MNPLSPKTVLCFALALVIGNTCLMLRRSTHAIVAEKACIGLQTFSMKCSELAQRF